jgi:hypothetical protein
VAQWLHDTPWRQGHVLTEQAAKALNLVHSAAPESTRIIIVSHDCDLAQDPSIEPCCEAVIGRTIDSQDGNYAEAKSVRRLHLECSAGSKRTVVDLEIQQKISIRKENLADHIPDQAIRLSRREKTILKAWLAARYSRPSFPDEFDKRLTHDARKTYEKFVRIFKRHSNSLVAVYFDVDEEERRGPEDVYALSIYLVYNVEKDGGKNAATSAAAEIKQVFQEEFLATGKWLNIELIHCDPVAESALSIWSARYFKKWHLDHLSLRDDEQIIIATA